MIYPNCSEVTYKLDVKNRLLDPDKEKVAELIVKIMKGFSPYDDDPLSCGTFTFFGELDDGDLIFRGRDDCNEDFMEEVEKEAKELKVKIEEIEDCKPLFAENGMFYYKQNGQVKVAELKYTNIEEANKINQELLKMWDRENVNKLSKEIEDDTEY